MLSTQQRRSKFSKDVPTSLASPTLPLNEKQLHQLKAQGFTQSLAESFNDVKQNFPLRIWVVDNSGSMNTKDGHCIVKQEATPAGQTNNKVVMRACSRWAELSSCVEYHMRLASLIEAPTQFRLLNPSYDPTAQSQFSIAERQHYNNASHRSSEVEEEVAKFRRNGPHGATPLTRHIREIQSELVAMAPALRQNGQRVCVVLATDGKPTNRHGSTDAARDEFVAALRSLEGLPVWVVIRLCTDDDGVVSFWNDIDSILELDIDVLDDFTAEANEIAEFNPWINYALPLHRLREFGNPDRLYDLIDERAFTKSEARDFCSTVFGQDSFDGVADPNVDWQSFLSHLASIAEETGKVWNPIERRQKKWVSANKLRRGIPWWR